MTYVFDNRHLCPLLGFVSAPAAAATSTTAPATTPASAPPLSGRLGCLLFLVLFIVAADVACVTEESVGRWLFFGGSTRSLDLIVRL